MDHNPDPYDDETEIRSRANSWKALAWTAGLTLAAILLLGAFHLGRWLASLVR